MRSIEIRPQSIPSSIPLYYRKKKIGAAILTGDGGLTMVFDKDKHKRMFDIKNIQLTMVGGDTDGKTV